MMFVALIRLDTFPLEYIGSIHPPMLAGCDCPPLVWLFERLEVDGIVMNYIADEQRYTYEIKVISTCEEDYDEYRNFDRLYAALTDAEDPIFTKPDASWLQTSIAK